MSEQILNLFPIDGLSQLTSKYRLLRVTNLNPNSDYAENLQRLTDRVSRATRKPVSLYKAGGNAYLATTANPAEVETEWVIGPHIAVLIPDPDTYTLSYSSIEPEFVDVALNLLRYDIRTTLMYNPELWNATAGSFYVRAPANGGENSQIDILEGFIYRLHYLQDGKIYLSLDPTARYIDRLSLAQRVSSDKQLAELKEEIFLYRFGQRWYNIRLTGATGQSISEQVFYHSQKAQSFNVYDYTLQNCRLPQPAYIKQLNPASPAITYTYPDADDESYGAAALCFKTYTTQDRAVRGMHRRSILNPAVRIEKTRNFIRRYLSRVSLGGGRHITVAEQPLTQSTMQFPMPKLLFGNNKVLEFGPGGAGDSGNGAGDQRKASLANTRIQSAQDGHTPNNGVTFESYPLREMGTKRLDALLDQRTGLLTAGVMPAQYMLIPQSFDRSIAEHFRGEMARQMLRLLSGTYTIETILFDDRQARTLAQQSTAITKALTDRRVDRGAMLLVLPQHADNGLHDLIKKELFQKLPVQCVTASALLPFYANSERGVEVRPGMRSKFNSYTLNTAIGMLLVNRKWPFALHSALQYDVHIGVDVLNGMAGFTYIYNGGKDCFFRYGEVTQPKGRVSRQARRPEKLTENQIRTILYRDLRTDITGLGIQPASIIIHRDGRSFEQEEAGLAHAVERLTDDGLLAPDVSWGVVEVHKSSVARLRLYEQANGRLDTLRNPTVGSYFIVNNHEGIVCNTGWPFSIPGTVNPLHVSVARSSVATIDIEKALHDVFALSQLAWTAPDKPARLPITIKLGDTLLQPIAAETEDDTALYGDTSDD